MNWKAVLEPKGEDNFATDLCKLPLREGALARG